LASNAGAPWPLILPEKSIDTHRRQLVGNYPLRKVRRHVMASQLIIDEVLATTRAVRKRLDFTRPIGKAIAMLCLYRLYHHWEERLMARKSVRHP
jgi:hypothetical protein